MAHARALLSSSAMRARTSSMSLGVICPRHRPNDSRTSPICPSRSKTLSDTRLCQSGPGFNVHGLTTVRVPERPRHVLRRRGHSSGDDEQGERDDDGVTLGHARLREWFDSHSGGARRGCGLRRSCATRVPRRRAWRQRWRLGALPRGDIVTATLPSRSRMTRTSWPASDLRALLSGRAQSSRDRSSTTTA